MSQKIYFHTENINERLYIRFIRYYLYKSLGRKQYNKFIEAWTLTVYPEKDASEDPHFDGRDGIGGVTGINTSKFYLRDKRTLKGDIFKGAFRENAVVISHELAHAMLIWKGMMWRTKLRNDDYSGHKAGTELNYSTAEVHDRHMEGNFWLMEFWFWDWKTFRAMKLRAKVLEVRDIVAGL